MKTFAFIVTIFTIMTLVYGCMNEPMSTEQLGKDDGFKVQYLFEKDGVKVYRFFDNGRLHYFTTNGETMTTQRFSKNDYKENIKPNF